ncbi:YeeE/YedE family protein [Lysobacter sp. A3-1-A15]|uniref:YeeE/YedE family protein n=1 Tax=Novilysobacter viscosus TaxID=3098602 RepID=UPI002ED8BE4A
MSARTHPAAYALLSGALFGLGLAVSGMTDPDKVLNFLDIAGRWDPSLALVMGGALAVAVPGFAWVRRRGEAWTGGAIPPAPAPRFDARLLIGSMLFGVGWGIAGFCPGPALATLAHGSLEPVIFVLAMLAGSQAARLFDAS